jgi:hypothetical protein
MKVKVDKEKKIYTIIKKENMKEWEDKNEEKGNKKRKLKRK